LAPLQEIFWLRPKAAQDPLWSKILPKAIKFLNNKVLELFSQYYDFINLPDDNNTVRLKGMKNAKGGTPDQMLYKCVDACLRVEDKRDRSV